MNKFLKRKSIVLQDLFSIQETRANNHFSKQNLIDLKPLSTDPGKKKKSEHHPKNQDED